MHALSVFLTFLSCLSFIHSLTHTLSLSFSLSLFSLPYLSLLISLSLEFMINVVNYFDIGPTSTHVGAAVFSGSEPWLSPTPTIPNCPNTTAIDVHNATLTNGTTVLASYVRSEG